ncbi:hypothetical protein GETHLI_32230 [Geothrix limicola]|uniref:Major facilitator superfamily (MFS) profile domain-containing protein n=1 Tax=Geothrix limicola TaxID=2927978 RepID=A0ABQ5QK20_9BACT|nr:MFS transporter [Geothrix limicola]GLH74721.1 hypothetical protein GETHLI_32230 [Geothrix limicola]
MRSPSEQAGARPGYLPFLLLISGLGGLLAGVDFGIIGSALEFLNKTIKVSEAQLSFIVAIYTGGGVLASFFAGFFADWLGRKKLMVAGGAAFVLSIFLIYTSQGFLPLLLGRVLMGLSGGIICVVVPLYMAECLPAGIRGRGTAIFQFMLTLGMVAAGAIGVFFTNRNAASLALAQQLHTADPAALQAATFKANSEAWRNMFLVAAVPGLIFSLGALLVKESPRWLFRRGRADEAERILRLSRSAEQTALEMAEMGQHTDSQAGKGSAKDSLFQRKYVIPFLLACVVLAATQATGINSIIAYAVIILRGAGLDAVSATLGFTIITALNCAMTLVGAALVDRVGRRFLLKLGTLGIIATLCGAAFVYRGFEAQRKDVDAEIRALVQDNQLEVDLHRVALPGVDDRPMALTVLYTLGAEQKVVRAFMPTAEDLRVVAAAEPLRAIPEAQWSADQRRALAQADGILAAQKLKVQSDPRNPVRLEIARAKWGPTPTPTTGWLVTALLCLFVAFFAVGPGVCVWLALTELMPTRIRSTGMGVAMVLNNGVQFVSALVFLPVVGRYGFHAMFFAWAGCTVIYFLTAAFFMPETKGRTLEEIEDHFAGKHA